MSLSGLTPTAALREKTDSAAYPSGAIGPSFAGPTTTGGMNKSTMHRVLQIAHVCHPDESMESRIGWRRATQAARRYQVTVLHGAPDSQSLLEARAGQLDLGDRLTFVPVERRGLGKLLNRTATTYYLGYRQWHRSAYKEARRLHERQSFDLVHQTTFSGFREPGYGWKLGVPFVWGPVGGTQSFPTAYLGQLGLRAAWIEVVRNAINAWQLRYSPHVRQAVRKSTVLIAATRRAQADLKRHQGVDAPVLLETGVDTPLGRPNRARKSGEPFKLLWAGRLRPWKTLPLLLKALPTLPADLDWRLRVLGVGPCAEAWRGLTERLGVADRVEWLGWPAYHDTLPHYRWADAFAFTSMRDTSGTGLLESLAAGTPVLGVDHQGAADILTAQCSLLAPVGRPQETIAGFSGHIERLARDEGLWLRLSEGAQERAEHYVWELQAKPFFAWYDGAIAANAAKS